MIPPDRIVLAINQTLATMVGMAPEDAVGRPCSLVLPLENVEAPTSAATKPTPASLMRPACVAKAS